MTEQSAHDEVTRDMIDAAAEAGASSWFRLIAAADPTALGVSRSHISDRLVRCFDDPTDPSPEEVERMVERSGSFTTALFEGDVAEALYHADAANMKILLRLLNHDLLREHLAHDRGSIEAANRWLEPNIERYGWPDDDE